MGVMGSEWEVLKAIAELGGKSTVFKVAAKQGVNSDYARIILSSLGRADYLDVFANGRCEILPKGWHELKRKGWVSEDGQEAETAEIENKLDTDSLGREDYLDARKEYELGRIDEDEYRRKRAEALRRRFVAFR